MNNWTYGYEIEWGDIDRTVVIPEHLGAWEFSETDVVNLKPPYENVACDPLGLDPPMGGEINVKPTKTIDEMIERIKELQGVFPNATSNCLSHCHLHFCIPGLTEDINLLKKLAKYIGDNQADFVHAVYDYWESPLLKYVPKAKTYLKYDGGRLMPDYMVNNILTRATDFESFIRMHQAGKDGVSLGRPFRYAINTYCLKHIGTVEFRCFRDTTDLELIRNCFLVAENFLWHALNDQIPVSQWVYEFKPFPPFLFDLDQVIGWEKTRWPKERGKKVRTYVPV